MDYFPNSKHMLPGYRFTTTDYDLFQVILVTGGMLYMKVRNKDTSVRPGEVLILRLGGAFELSCRESEYRGVAVCLHGGDREYGSAMRGAPMALVASPELRAVGSLMADELSRPRRGAAELLQGIGRVLVGYAHRLLRLQGPGDPRDVTAAYWADSVREVIERNVYSATTLRELFSEAGLSYRQLSRHFANAYGMTPKQYQVLCRIDEAKRLLAGTRLSITSIAMELGFPTSQHFAAQFRRHAGATPTAYRRRERVSREAT